MDSLGYTRRSNRKAFALRPVHTNKEIVDSVTLGVSGGINTTVALATSVNDYTGTVGTCPIGSSIKAINLQVTYQSNEATTGRLDWYLMKNPANQITQPIPGATGGDPARKFVFHESKGINPDDDGGPTRDQGWISIPKRYTRMGEDDRILIRFGASDIHDVCIKAVYKWFA